MNIGKKRILIDGEVLVTPHFSGIGHYTLEMLKALDRQLPEHPHIDVRVFVHFRHVDKALSYGFKNIRVVRSPFSLRIANGLKMRGFQPPLDLLFGKGIYIFPNYSSWPLLFSRAVPFIYDLSFEKYPEYAEPRNQAFLSEQVWKSIKRASHVATISENSRNEVHKFYKTPLKQIGVYYPAVDKDFFYRRPDSEIDGVKERYGIDGDYILFVGNIEPRKNLKNLLLAYENLDRKTRNKYSLLLVGAKGWQDGEIFQIIKRLQDDGNRIQRPNTYVNDPDLPAIYSGASLFVYPSIYEGFGIPPIEAMACGTPVIASNNSSLPEACGDAALLIDSDEPSQITKGISDFLNNPELCQNYIQRGHVQVQKFSWEKASRDFLESLKHL